MVFKIMSAFLSNGHFRKRKFVRKNREHNELMTKNLCDRDILQVVGLM